MRYRRGLAIKTPRGWIPEDEQVVISWDNRGEDNLGAQEERVR